ncbi:hypothetical protein BRADI_5g03258v3 [Brachypodium distachyon]|uniref:Uncharacterized protein n=1 Tax=Brachypodium distachyon TaxID=15368 RepID=A0A0Q3NZL7_BRADI|nr:hypothetical protein BRADI_5g03258v3 [Brachypodium distachyon]
MYAIYILIRAPFIILLEFVWIGLRGIRKCNNRKFHVSCEGWPFVAASKNCGYGGYFFELRNNTKPRSARDIEDVHSKILRNKKKKKGANGAA